LLSAASFTFVFVFFEVKTESISFERAGNEVSNSISEGGERGRGRKEDTPRPPRMNATSRRRWTEVEEVVKGRGALPTDEKALKYAIAK